MPLSGPASPFVETTTPDRLASLGRRIFHRRMHVGLAVVALMAFCIRPRLLHHGIKDPTVLCSLALIFAGLFGRGLAAGFAGRHTRRATIEAPILVTCGPYAFVRNPIYLASIVLGLGMVGLLGDPWMLVPCVAVFMFLYISIVPAEEEMLKERFGQEYARYRANVPRFVPRLLPWPERRPGRFDWKAPLIELRLGLLLATIFALLHGAAWLRAALLN